MILADAKVKEKTARSIVCRRAVLDQECVSWCCDVGMTFDGRLQESL